MNANVHASTTYMRMMTGGGFELVAQGHQDIMVGFPKMHHVLRVRVIGEMVRSQCSEAHTIVTAQHGVK